MRFNNDIIIEITIKDFKYASINVGRWHGQKISEIHQE